MKFTPTIVTAILAARPSSFCQFFPSGSCNTLKQTQTTPDIAAQFRQAMANSSEQNMGLVSTGNKLLKKLEIVVTALDKETAKNANLHAKIGGLESDVASLRRDNEFNTIIIAETLAAKRDSDRKNEELVIEHSRTVDDLSTSLDQCKTDYRDAQLFLQTQSETLETCAANLSGCNTEKTELQMDIGEAARLHDATGQAKQRVGGIFSKYLPRATV